MNKTVSKFALAAGLLLAMAFTFSCSSDENGGGNETTPSSNSSGGETVFCKQNSGACSQFSLSTCMELVNAGAAQIVSSCDEPPPPPPPLISSSSTPGGNGSSSSNTTSGIYCGGSPYNPSSQFCFGTTIYQKCNGEEYNPIAIGGERACIGNELHIVAKIGTQTWMRENLDYNASGSKCYGNDPTNCSSCRLYDWNTARTICPSGWHLPTNAEWTTLINYAGGNSNAGSKLMGRTNDYNFSASPCGYYVYAFDSFIDIGKNGYWWSASEGSNNSAYFLSMNLENVVMDNTAKFNLFSVRCLQD